MNWLRLTVLTHLPDMAKATLVALAMLVIPIFIVVLLDETVNVFRNDNELFLLTTYFIGALVSIIFYKYINKIVFPRSYCDLPIANAFSKFSGGFTFGSFLILFTAFLLYITGFLNILPGEIQINDLFIFSFLVAPIVEEVFFRGVLLRYINLMFGKFWGITISSLAFGFVHIYNNHADVWSSLNIAIGSGVLFGLLYVASKNLWVPIGAHAGWNFCEGNFLGSANSGAAVSGFFKTNPAGSKIITGGNFGLEGSIILTLLCVAVSLLVLRRIKIDGAQAF